METENKPDSCRKILQAAISEFASRGYEAASTNRICRQAEISKGLLFHYYKSKEGLFSAVLEQCMQDIREASPEFLGNDLKTTPELIEFCCRQMRFFAEHSDHYFLIGELLLCRDGEHSPDCERLRREFLAFRAERVKYFLDHCRLQPYVERNIAVELLLHVTDVIQKKYIGRLHTHRESVEEILEEFTNEYGKILRMLLDGMAVPSKNRNWEDVHASCRN